MIQDIKNAFTITKNNVDNNPAYLKDIFDSHEYYWRVKSGILEHDSPLIWERVKKLFENDIIVINSSSPNHNNSSSRARAVIDINNKDAVVAKNNRWGYL